MRVERQVTTESDPRTVTDEVARTTELAEAEALQPRQRVESEAVVEQRDVDVGRTTVQGAWVAVWLTIVGWIAMGFPDVWLVMSHVDDRVGALVASYLHALMFALPAAASSFARAICAS